jgi:hypothetical protein
MKSQVTIMERRQHPRQGVMAEIEDLTYRVLRKYEINGPTEKPGSAVPEKAA